MNEDLIKQIYAMIRRRLSAAAIHLTNKAKENLSKPVPRIPATKRIRRKINGRFVVIDVATARPKGWWRYFGASGKPWWVEPATKGAFPRKFEGRGRSSVMWEILESTGEMIARVGTNTRYMRRHEFTNHRWLSRTLAAERRELERLLNG